jgi:hypothetical protein
MREQPTGDQLLEAARSLLRDELLPALPANQRHAALMIANAMAIAMRQLRNGEDVERREIAALARILSTPLGDDAASLPPSERDALLHLNRRLCVAIRQGHADAGKVRDSVREHLLWVARQRVAVSNPKYLGAEG